MPSFNKPRTNMANLPSAVQSVRNNITLTNAQPPNWVARTVDIGSAFVEVARGIAATYLQVGKVVIVPTVVAAKINKEIQSHLSTIAYLRAHPSTQGEADYYAADGQFGQGERSGLQVFRGGRLLLATAEAALHAAVRSGSNVPVVPVQLAAGGVAGDELDEELAVAAVRPGITLAIEPMWMRDP